MSALKIKNFNYFAYVLNDRQFSNEDPLKPIYGP